MVIQTIDGKMLQKMFLAGAKNIEAKKEYINELNVFPVPDGDTGTNMTLTIMAAAKEVSAITEPAIPVLAKAISSGSLRGARGNSGVILSQLFRGFTKEIKEYDTINVEIMSRAFERAVETAYKAVMKPKEGTILTVAKGGAKKAAEMAEQTDDLVYFCDEVLKYMEEVLSKTPEMLPVLKEAGVVDSGGQGLLTVLQGAYDALLGKEVVFEAAPAKTIGATVSSGEVSTADIKFGYCTEFIIMLEKEYTAETELAFKAYLESIGDSIVVVSDDDVVKVHVHTNDPGLAIQRALTYGSLTNMKIDNMREEHNEKVIREAEKAAAKQAEAGQTQREEPRKETGFISVSIGEGINEIFKGLGVDYIIEGGQTMNPSTDDMLTAIEAVNANNIFIFPNNKNIILAAEQAMHLTKDKNIIVIPSKTVPQGIAAIINFIAEKPIEENKKRMLDAMGGIKSGQVTYAVRDTSIDGKTIKENDFMGIGDSGILAVGQDMKDTTLELIDCLVEEDSELVSLYYGSDVDEVQAEELAELIEKKYPELEVEVNQGGQPIYYYVLSVE
ncbi:DAK2 domain-containing protein [Acetivibrio ethanolgignens]|uniref:Dihydroxyacetone kinase n=1 Tax=Acetivibrio ethanolgignens TaxID=290052 RepID=A0A0V8QG45_9FIRM|nr:DAK2 domain-containing protein [Acetivibrio ethanolgignens]KSV59537.1 dihydroxyacetone kinase [Acetivibrio ethanolgignens]